jgi:hypothetical protein
MANDPQAISIVFANGGTVIKSAPDEIALNAYKALLNVSTTRENSITVRRGISRLNDGLPADPICSYALVDYLDRQWRYSIANQQLYVAPVEDPEDPYIWPVALGSNFGAVTGASNLSSLTDPRAIFAVYTLYGTETKPYIFFADGVQFLKHPGGMAAARRVGIPKPANNIVSIETETLENVNVELCEDISRWLDGDSTLTSAIGEPSIWWQDGTAITPERFLYAKKTFIKSDGTETGPSDVVGPIWVPPGKTAKLFWKAQTRPLTRGTEYGGSGGIEFADIEYIPPEGCRVSKIMIWAYHYVYAMRVFYEDVNGTSIPGPLHGSPQIDSVVSTFTLDSDEYITGISGSYGGDGDYVHHIKFITNKQTSSHYGWQDGAASFSYSIPATTDTTANLFAGFCGRAAEYINKIGLVYWAYSYDDADTAEAGATGWNAYVGTTLGSLKKVNAATLGLGEYCTEPVTGFSYGAAIPFFNQGDVSEDLSGQSGNAITLTINGDGTQGRATTYFVNESDYPVVLDLGTNDPDESFTFYVKFADATSKSNCASIELRFWFSDIAGDTGEIYQYCAYATLEPADFSGCVVGSWSQIVVYKSAFVLITSGSALTNLGWNTVSAVSLSIANIDATTGSGNCIVGFDSLIFVPTAKLSGSDLKWAFTYFNSLTNTESDFSNIFELNETLDEQQVRIVFPVNPATTPPMADPNKIHIYRMGGTVDAFRLVAEIDYFAGASPEYVDNVADSMLGAEMDYENQLPPEEVRGVVAYDNRLWTWGGELEGISEPKNRLRFSKNVEVEAFPTDNYIYAGPSEEILRAWEHNAELFIFTTVQVYRVIGSEGNYRAVSAGVNQGIKSICDVCRGPNGLFIRAYDGIYEFPGGRKISEPVNNIFVGGETVNEHPPVASGQEWQECMEFRDSKLYFCYPSNISGSGPTASNDRMLVWDTLYERWSHYLYGCFHLFTEPKTNLLVGSTMLRYGAIADGVPEELGTGGPWPLSLESGYADYCYDIYGSDSILGIPYLIDTKEYDMGLPDQEKQFIDFVVDCEAQGSTITIEIARDQSDSTTGMHEALGTITGTGREQTILPVPPTTGNSASCRRLQIRIYGTTEYDATRQMVLYKIIHRFLVEPGRHNVFVTAWSDYGVPTPKFFRELWMEIDTFGVALDSIEVQIDQAVAQIIEAIADTTFLNADGRTKWFLGLEPDLRGTIARLKIVPTGTGEVKLYDHGFQVIPEPPTITTLQTPYSDQEWPYNKLWKEVVLDIDTIERPVTVYFWLDGVIKDHWEVATEFRKEVTHSLPQDLIGKLGRITINEDFGDECDELNGFRFYKNSYVVDNQPPDVTIADSYVQTLNFDRVKILRRLWIAVKNPDEYITVEIYADGKLKAPAKVIAADPQSTGYSIRRVDFEAGVKGMLFRILFTSKAPFEIHPDKSFLEGKGLNPEDTYAKIRLSNPQTL